MNNDLLIKYEDKNANKNGYDLGVLGESFTGFNQVFKEIFEISQLQGELVFKTTKITEGSIEVQNVLEVIVNSTPFNNVQDFLDFLQIANTHLHEQASTYFTAIGNGHKNVNDFFREYEFSGSLLSGSVSGFLSGLMVSFVVKSTGWSGKLKNASLASEEVRDNIPEKTAVKLQRMISSGKFKKALKPILESGIEEISLASNNNREKIIIDETKLGNYLPDEERILPDLINGMEVTLIGEIVALQSTRGEKIKFKAEDIESKFQLLTAHPDDDKKTEDYKDFYKKQVNIKAEIFRKTLFKKPELIIKEIELSQESLFTDEGVDPEN